MNRPQKLTLFSILKGISANHCPRCLHGHVFLGIYQMRTSCDVCALVFEKEPGYFLGSAIAAYFIGAFSLVPTLIILLLFLKLEFPVVIAIGTLQILMMHPFLYRYSKLAWLFVETKMTQTLEGEDNA